MATSAITTLFLDIGGVLLTNGWDTDLRKQTAEHFGLDYEEIYHRHHVTYDIYEEGKMTLDEYLWQIVFYEPRPFTPEDFKNYLLEQAKPYQDTIDLVKRLKAVYGLSVAVVSNEGREIAEDRIRRFNLKDFVDFFIVSAFVHIRKPDLDIYRLALDVAHVKAENVAYIEDRPLLVRRCRALGPSSRSEQKCQGNPRNSGRHSTSFSDREVFAIFWRADCRRHASAIVSTPFKRPPARDRFFHHPACQSMGACVAFQFPPERLGSSVGRAED